MTNYTRNGARNTCEGLESWSDEDFGRAEMNWKEACITEWNTPEDAELQEPYPARFLDWCSENN